MAYKKAFGSTPATYESSSTSAFKHGRTETVRPATLATNAACELLAKNSSRDEILAALSECSKVHGNLTRNAAMGLFWFYLFITSKTMLKLWRIWDTNVAM